MAIVIRTATSIADFQIVGKLSDQLWGSDSSCSAAQLSVHGAYGGVVFVAEDDGQPVGFLLSFPARYHGEWVLWSHATGLVESHRHQGLGAMLKFRQRHFAKELGYERIAWTFDPLVARNAYFNLNKLGAGIAEYKVNVYGESPDDLINRGLATDRFVAVWDISETNAADPQMESTWVAKQPVVLNRGADGRPILTHTRDLAKYVLTHVPPNLEATLLEDPEGAARWRYAFRDVAQRLLASYVPRSVYRSNGDVMYVWERRANA